ncbi:putative serine/threonine/dual specificity protein kinase, catalytic domain-containing protein [Tanacetum coccineum]
MPVCVVHKDVPVRHEEYRPSAKVPTCVSRPGMRTYHPTGEYTSSVRNSLMGNSPVPPLLAMGRNPEAKSRKVNTEDLELRRLYRGRQKSALEARLGSFKTEKNRKRYLDMKTMQDQVRAGVIPFKTDQEILDEVVPSSWIDIEAKKKQDASFLREKQTAEAQQRAYLAALKADAAYQNIETMYGAVGFIDDGGTTIASKRLNYVSRQGASEIWTEVKMLSRARHGHLVSLIGYHNEFVEMMVVYEYILLANKQIITNYQVQMMKPLWGEEYGFSCNSEMEEGFRILIVGFVVDEEEGLGCVVGLD